MREKNTQTEEGHNNGIAKRPLESLSNTSNMQGNVNSFIQNLE